MCKKVAVDYISARTLNLQRTQRAVRDAGLGADVSNNGTSTRNDLSPRTSIFGRCIEGGEPINTSARKGKKELRTKKIMKTWEAFKNKNKIEGQVLGDVLLPTNLNKDKEFVLDSDIYVGKKVVGEEVVDEMVVVDCNLDANKELTCNIKEVKKSEVLDTTDFRALIKDTNTKKVTFINKVEVYCYEQEIVKEKNDKQLNAKNDKSYLTNGIVESSKILVSSIDTVIGNSNKNVVNDESNVIDNVKSRFKGLLDKFENLKCEIENCETEKNNIGNISNRSFNFTKLKSFWEQKSIL